MADEAKEDIRVVEKRENAKVNVGEVPTRKVRFIMINPQSFLGMFQTGLTLSKRMKVIQGVPDDAKVINMTVDHVRGGIILVIESEEYEPIPMTNMPPVQLLEVDLGMKGGSKPPKKRKR